MINTIGTQNQGYMENDISNWSKVNGTWQLLWTTEKKTLYFIQNGLFGRSVDCVCQTIDTKREHFKNLIKFQDNLEFSLCGRVKRDVNKRIRLNFSLSEAVITIPYFPTLMFPSVGSDWNDNIYVNDCFRLSRDCHGNYFIMHRIT